MKKLILLLALLSLIGCAEPNNAEQDPPQDYTSFIFWHDLNITLENSIIGYYAEDGVCYRLATLGELLQNIHSLEVRVDDDSIKDLYFFCDNYGGIRLKQVFKLQQNRKNIFKIEDKGSDSINKNDPKQYPQEKSPE